MFVHGCAHKGNTGRLLNYGNLHCSSTGQKSFQFSISVWPSHNWVFICVAISVCSWRVMHLLAFGCSTCAVIYAAEWRVMYPPAVLMLWTDMSVLGCVCTSVWAAKHTTGTRGWKVSLILEMIMMLPYCWYLLDVSLLTTVSSSLYNPWPNYTPTN